MCKNVDAQHLPLLERKIEEWVAQLSLLDGYLGPNLKVARALAECSLMLVSELKNLVGEQQALAVGAILYLTYKNDDFHDTKPIFGLDDDVRVINYVLQQLGFTAWMLQH